MLKNNNSKFINTLSRNCMKANRLRNLIAVFAIILTTVLFTTVGTILEGSMQTIKEQQIVRSGTRFMMSAKYISEEASEKLMTNPAFSEVGKTQYLGEVQNEELKKIAVNISWADEAFVEGFFANPQKGSMPEKEDEVLIDSVVLKMLGLPEETGRSVSLSYEVNGNLNSKTVKIAGIYKGNDNEDSSTVYCSRALFDKETEGLEPAVEGSAGTGSILIYGSFPSEKNLDEKREQVLKEAGFNPGAVEGEEGFVKSNINSAYWNGAGVDIQVAAGAIILFAAIMLAGYLIISNVFRISVLKDMRMYGQLKTIGTSPHQLRKLLKKQANTLNLIGIPLGLLLGFFLGKLLLPAVMEMTVYTDVGKISPRLWVFAASAVFSFLTVWISCRRPSVMMSRMSPIQALRYQGREESGRKQTGGRESKRRILQMAMSNVTDSKGKTFLVVLSLSLSVILFNSVLNFTNCFDKDTFVKGRSAADFIVSNASYETRNESEKYVVPQEFLDEVKKQDNIRYNGSMYCYQAPDETSQNAADKYDGIQTTKILTVNGKEYPKENAMELGKMLYGADSGLFPKWKVVRGTLDTEKLATGKYIIEAIDFRDNNEDYDDFMFTLKPGDKVKGEIGGVTLEYEVIANVVIQPEMMFTSSMGEGAVLILPSEEYLNRFPGKLPIHYIMDAKEGKHEEVNAFLEDYEEKPGANIKFKSRDKVVEEFNEYKTTYAAAGTVLAALFGAIGILNLLNVILTNAIARQQEFAVMQSIGMTRKQLRRLFVIEGVMYTVLAGIFSLVLSAVLSVTAVKGLTNSYWFCVYRFSILPASLLVPVFIAAAGLTALVIDRIWNNGSVVERLRSI